MSIIEQSLLDDEPPAGIDAGGSLLDRLREQQTEIASSKTLDLPITGRKHPELVARYRFIDVEESKEIAKRIRDRGYDDRGDLAEAMLLDPMIEACIGLYAREGDKLEPVGPDDGGGPCRYDDRLENFFSVPPSGSARAAVLVAFLGNGHAALGHARRLTEWFNDTSKTAEQLLGEA